MMHTVWQVGCRIPVGNGSLKLAELLALSDVRLAVCQLVELSQCQAQPGTPHRCWQDVLLAKQATAEGVGHRLGHSSGLQEPGSKMWLCTGAAVQPGLQRTGHHARAAGAPP